MKKFGASLNKAQILLARYLSKNTDNSFSSIVKMLEKGEDVSALKIEAEMRKA